MAMCMRPCTTSWALHARRTCRYALDLSESGSRSEALGIARRVAAKFDLEPESQLAAIALLWGDEATAVDRDEALVRWRGLPEDTQRRMVATDTAARDWPPSARRAASAFLGAAPPMNAPADAQTAPLTPPKPATPLEYQMLGL